MCCIGLLTFFLLEVEKRWTTSKREPTFLEMHSCHDNIHILRTTLDDICVSFFAWICFFVNIFGCCFDRLKTETNSESVVEANLLLVAQYRGQAHTQPGVKKKDQPQNPEFWCREKQNAHRHSPEHPHPPTTAPYKRTSHASTLSKTQTALEASFSERNSTRNSPLQDP